MDVSIFRDGLIVALAAIITLGSLAMLRRSGGPLAMALVCFGIVLSTVLLVGK